MHEYPYDTRTLAALIERMFPADENGPGATEIGVVAYIRGLRGDEDRTEFYKMGLGFLDAIAGQRYGHAFADCLPDQQDTLISDLETGSLPLVDPIFQRTFFDQVRADVQEGLFSDPVHGGNRDKLGWKLLNHPGVWMEN